MGILIPNLLGKGFLMKEPDWESMSPQDRVTYEQERAFAERMRRKRQQEETQAAHEAEQRRQAYLVRTGRKEMRP